MQEEISFEDGKTLDLALDIYSYNQKVNMKDVSDQQKTKLRDAVICMCRVLDIKIDDKGKYQKIGSNESGDVFVRNVGGGKYVAFRLTYDEKPKVVGRTIPLTKKQLEEEGIKL